MLGPLGRSSGSGQKTILVFDPFIWSDDGKHLHDHAPAINTTGNPWVSSNNVLVINDQAFQNASNQIAYIDCGTANCIITAKMGYPYSSIVARYVDALNYWKASVNTERVTVSLIERSAGSEVTRASTVVYSTLSTGIFIRLDGTKIEIGDPLTDIVGASYTSSSHLTATKHGLYQASAGYYLGDDFKVTTL
jgi:hypothetical protein